MIYTLAASSAEGNSALVCYYTNERGTENKKISINYKGTSDKKLYYILVDENHKFTEIFPENNEIELMPNSFVFITEDDMAEYLDSNKPEVVIAAGNKDVCDNI